MAFKTLPIVLEAKSFLVRHHLEALVHRASLFWVVWCFLTAAVVICTGWVFRSSTIPVLRKQKGPREVQFPWRRSTVICLALLSLFLGAYVAMILIGEDFAMYDNSQFTAFSLRGVNLPIRFSPQEGRFWPLGLQEFNLIGHVTKTIAGYQAFPIMELALLAFALLNLDKQLRISSRVALTILALIAPGVVASFTGLIYSERNVLVLLVCLALFVQLFEQTHYRRYAVAAVVSAQLMLYLKEPVFLMLLGFSAARLVLRNRHARNASWLCDEDNRLDLCIAAVSIAFLAFYLLMMLPYTRAEYLAYHHVSMAEAARYYMRVDVLAWTFAVVAIVRMFRSFRGSIAPLLLWDGLACGGVVYFAAYLALRMVSSYYLAPVDLIAVLYLGHLLLSSWGELRLGARVPAAALALIVAGQSLELSTFHVLQRKLYIRQKAAIARLILDTSHREPRSALNLYFPVTNPYGLVEFAAYLSYRGLPVEEQSGDDFVPKAASVRFFAAKIAKDGRCVIWRNFVCHAGAVNPAGLAIVLPEDAPSPDEVKVFRESEERLPSYDPRIRPPGWLLTVLSFLWVHGAR
jgi:hypothetical protein